MFKFSNVDGNVELGISVEGYQFPNDQEDDWCFIRVGVKQGEEEFDSIDPALETTELIELRNWFECLSHANLPRYATLSFTEPCLEFEFLAYKSGVVRFAIHLSHEVKPDFKLYQFGRSNTEWNIVFELSKNQLTGVVSGIESAMNLYPVRGQS